MAETLTIRTASSTEVVKIAVPGPQGPKGDKGDPGDVAGLPLSTLGDTLYRGASENQRLPIGTTGQVLKVSAQGLPAWANESGAVSSVNGQTGAVILDGSDIESSGNDVDAAFIAATFDEGDGIYFPLPDSFINSKPVYRTTSGHSAFFENSRWHITDGSPVTTNIIESSDNDNAAWPWLSAWSGDVTKAKLSDVVGRARDTFLFVGDSIPNTSVSGLASVAASGDYDDLSGKPAIPSASSATPSALGTAAAGSSNDFARADHVHSTPSAADVGAAPSTFDAAAADKALALWDSAAGANALEINDDEVSLAAGCVEGFRDALGLGTAAVADIGNGAGEVCAGDDARLSDSRTPTAHAASHASAGSDPLAPSDIGAQSLFTSTTLSITADTNLSAARATIYNVSVGSAGSWKIIPATTGSIAGDVIIVFHQPIGSGNALTFTNGLSPSGIQTIAQNERYRFVYSGTVWQVDPVYTHTHAASAITSGTLTHERGGLEADVSAYNGLVKISGGSTSAVGIGTGSTEVAAGDHGHGNINSSGLVGTVANLPLKTGTGGIVEAGAFGTGAGEFAEGNHTHTQLHDRSHAITSTSDHTAGNHKVFYSNGSGEIVELALGNSGEVLTSNGATSAPSFAAASGGGVTTGSVDNAILRADGTGGSTSQSSDLVIDDATTSTQANVAILNAHSETNSALVLSPKGTGAFIIGPKPDGTSTGGNARGQKAVDLSFQRAAATQVASGNYSMVLGGDRCTASGTTAIAGGERATASAAYTVALGRVSTASGNAAAVIGGQDNTASGAESIVVGGDTNTASAYVAAAFGNFGLADRSGLIAQANGRFAANGDAQWIHMVLRAKTTTNSAVELLINNGRTTNGRLTCPSGKIISGIINIHGVKSDGTASAHYVRQFQVKNVGGTSSYPYAAETIGTDYASSTSITFNDPDTNGDALSVSVTGIASETWRWTAHVSAVETTYGT